MLFQLAPHLDEAEHHDLADRAYERAHRRVEGLPRVEPRRWPSLVSYAMLFGWSRDTVERAVREERPDQVDRILERVAETFPRLEFTPMAWSALADWLDRQVREKLAAKWRDRGVRAAESPWPQVRELASMVDLAIALLVGFLISILGSAFVIGVRSARTDESQGWLVRPRSAEMVGLIAALAVPFATLWLQQSRAETIEVIAEVPIEVLNDGLASPAVEQWLEQLHPSESRDALLEDVRTMRRAVEDGEFECIELVRHSRVLDAIRAHGRAEAWDSLMGRAGADGLERIGYDYHPAWLLAGLPGLFVLVLGGGVVAFYVPASKRVIRYVVPGAARSAGFFTPFILGVAVASPGDVWSVFAAGRPLVYDGSETVDGPVVRQVAPGDG